MIAEGRDLTYSVGIDVGTTYTAAAVERDGRSEMVTLTSHGVVAPSVAWLGTNGDWLVGAAAERRAQADPDRAAREFKRRFGDTSPLLLGSSPVSVDQVTSQVLSAVLARIAETEGGPPERVAVTHPASWGPYKLDLLEGACRRAGIDEPVLVPEPVAAAVHYAAQREIADGALVAVYDLGGGTFDATVLRANGDTFEMVGEPEGLERLGGIDLDAAVLAHVRRSLGDALPGDGDAEGRAALQRLRDECRTAKEALSEDTEATIVVPLPSGDRQVRLTRAELEEMAQVPVRETVTVLGRTISGSGHEVDEMDRVLLVGGASRMPLVAETLRSETGREVVVDAHPKHTVALGAAALAASSAQPPATAPVTGATVTTTSQRSASGRVRHLVAAGLAGVVAVAAAIWLATGSSGTDDPPRSTSTTAPPATMGCCPVELTDFPTGALPAELGLAASFEDVAVRAVDGGVWRVDPVERVGSELRDIGGTLTDVAEVPVGDDVIELWVTDVAGGRVVALEATTLEPRGEIPLGGEPQSLAVAPDGAVWVTDAASGTVTVLDPTDRSALTTLEVPAGPIVVRHTGDTTWVVSLDTARVTAVATSTREVIAEAPVGRGPLDAQLLEGRIWVPNALDGTVTVIDAADPTAEPETLDVGGAVSVAPTLVAGRVAVATGDAPGVALIDPATRRVDAYLPAGERPVAVAVAGANGGEGNGVIVSDVAAGEVLVTAEAFLAGALDGLEADADDPPTLEDVAIESVPVGDTPVGLVPVPDGVLVELFPGAAMVLVELPGLGVVPILPGSADGSGNPNIGEPGGPTTPQGPGPNGQGPITTGRVTTSSVPSATVDVPNVVGLEETTARAVLADRGLSASTTAVAGGTEGVVAAQTPSAGSGVDEGSTVTLSVGSGPVTTRPPTPSAP